jgi:hypothetical protein
MAKLSTKSAVLIMTLAFAACGGDTSGNESSDAGVDVGAPINLADCTDWNDASVEGRLGTIAQIRDFTGGPVAGTDETGAVLDDQEAYDFFEDACEPTYARAFKLYKLYGRAAAFQSYSEQAEDSSQAP